MYKVWWVPFSFRYTREFILRKMAEHFLEKARIELAETKAQLEAYRVAIGRLHIIAIEEKDERTDTTK